MVMGELPTTHICDSSEDAYQVGKPQSLGSPLPTYCLWEDAALD